jgi:lipoyl(octanoyl) transferase
MRSPSDTIGQPVEWVVTPGLVPYAAACALMAQRVEAILAGTAREVVWLIEHPALYTAGTSARASDLLEPGRFPVHRSGRGGQYTYHGPGQRVAYVMLDVGRRFGDVRAYVAALEAWIIEALAQLGVEGGAMPGRVGIWVPLPGERPGSQEKIAAIGVRLRRWISSHGVSINVAPDLSHFSGIVPCGIADNGVTSLARLGLDVRVDEVDQVLRVAFERRFGPTCEAPPMPFSLVAGADPSA